MSIRIALLALASLLPMVSFADVAGKAAGSTTTAAAAARAPRPTITLVNLNTADAATLARDMDGIGATKAEAIIEHRKSKGAFRSVDDLALVKGIGSKTLERNRARLTVGGPGGSAKSPVAKNPATNSAGAAAPARGSSPSR